MKLWGTDRIFYLWKEVDQLLSWWVVEKNQEKGEEGTEAPAKRIC
jgi:hypothetical protein